ncbi:MAG: integrator complex subunit 3 [Terracidiphilus sp.]|nr:integrator complex subunit 3 [Terracidiphilus sp.]
MCVCISAFCAVHVCVRACAVVSVPVPVLVCILACVWVNVPLARFFSSKTGDTLMADTVRYCCCLFHPSNKLLQSAVVPRWAMIGWLLSTRCVCVCGSGGLRVCRCGTVIVVSPCCFGRVYVSE